MVKDVRRGFSGLQVFGIVVAAIFIAVIATVFFIKYWLFPSPFKPVVLSEKEEIRLERKINRIEKTGKEEKDFSANPTLKPEAYSEKGAKREIHFTEREINALIAKNTDLAKKVAIDLSENLVSAKVLLPVDPDFPILGGKTLRFKAGLELAYKNGHPVVKIKGVSIMGIPVPSAWLGGLKNVDLVKKYGDKKGFWKAFSNGVKSITVKDGEIFIQLKE